MKKIRIQKDYNRTAAIYNNRYAKLQFAKFEILHALPLRGTLLDLGGGTGLLGRYLEDRELINLDISLEMLKKSEEKNICGDMEFIPLKSSCFDAVLSFTALQNLKDFSKIFKEIKRVLRLKGFAVVSVLNKVNTNKLEKEAKLAGFKIKEKTISGEDIQLILLTF